jgi:bla regulator protein BlaR1
MPSCENFLWLLLQTSLQAGGVVLVVFAVRAICGRFITHRWRHALWMIVLLRLLLPVLPQGRFGLFSPGMFHRQSNDSARDNFVVQNLPDHFSVSVKYDPVPVLPAPMQTLPIARPQVAATRWPPILLAIWLVGVVSLMSNHLWINFRFNRSLGRSGSPVPHRVPGLLQTAAKELRLARQPIVILTDAVDAPAVAGVFRAKILLPDDLPCKLSDDQLRLVLLHELAHVKCFDVAVDWLWAIAQSLHWFNPLVWLISPLRRNDRELARDEMVLLLSGDWQKQSYGRLLIELSRGGRSSLFFPGLAGMSHRGSGLQRRIEMIANHNGKRPVAACLGLTVLAVAGCCALTSPATKPATTSVARFAAPATRESSGGPGSEIVIRRYDVNDLLFVPPDYSNAPDLSVPSPVVSQNLFANTANATTTTKPDRAGSLEDLRKYIIDNVDPESWKENGGAGTITSGEKNSMLMISQSVNSQQKVQAVLDDLRHSRGKQLSIETRIIVLDESVEKKLPDEVQRRLAAVRHAGRYRRDEFLSQEQSGQLIRAVQSDASTTSLTAPRLTLFNGQHAVLVVQTQQAYVADMKRVPNAGSDAKAPWHDEPVVKSCTATGVVLDVVACTAPDDKSVFVDLHNSMARLLGMPSEMYGDGREAGQNKIQRPVLSMFKINAACGIPDKTDLLLGGSDTIDSGDPAFNANSPSRPATDAEIKRLTEEQSHRHVYLLIRPTILNPVVSLHQFPLLPPREKTLPATSKPAA